MNTGQVLMGEEHVKHPEVEVYIYVYIYKHCIYM